MIGASQSALSIQKPSQSGPRTHPVDHFLTHAAAVPISSTAAGEESSAIRAVEYAVGGALGFIVARLRYLWICISTPPPVALTLTPFCVEEMRTITPV